AHRRLGRDLPDRRRADLGVGLLSRALGARALRRSPGGVVWAVVRVRAGPARRQAHAGLVAAATADHPRRAPRPRRRPDRRLAQAPTRTPARRAARATAAGRELTDPRAHRLARCSARTHSAVVSSLAANGTMPPNLPGVM